MELGQNEGEEPGPEQSNEAELSTVSLQVQAHGCVIKEEVDDTPLTYSQADEHVIKDETDRYLIKVSREDNQIIKEEVDCTPIKMKARGVRGRRGASPVSEQSPRPEPPASAGEEDAPAALLENVSSSGPSRASSTGLSEDDGTVWDCQVPAPAQEPRRWTDKLHLPLADEQVIADWFAANPIFYDKTRRDYKDAEEKKRMMDEKAATLSVYCTGLQLKRWLDSMRTCAGKLVKLGPSGDYAKKKLTKKEEWIVNNFGFLRDHIRRIVPLRGTTRKRNSSREEDEESTSAIGTQGEDSDSESAHPDPPGGGCGQEQVVRGCIPKAKSLKKRRKEASSTSLLVRQLVSSALQKEKDIRQETSTEIHEARVRNWCSYVQSEALDLEKEDYEDFQMQVVGLLHQMKKAARKRRVQQQQPPPPVP